MALLSILTGKVPKRTRFQNASGIDLLLVDATLSLTPTYGAKVTQHPVEKGSDITDHINLDNITISMEGFASETPVGFDPLNVLDASSFQGAVAGGAAAIGSFAGSKIAGTLGGSIGAVAGGIGTNLLFNARNKAEITRDTLLNMMSERKTFTLVAQNVKYENLVFTSLVFPKDASTGRGLKFSASMQQIRIVESDVIQIDALSPSVVHSAAANSKLGRQATKTASEQRGKSILVALGLPGR